MPGAAGSACAGGVVGVVEAAGGELEESAGVPVLAGAFCVAAGAETGGVVWLTSEPASQNKATGSRKLRSFMEVDLFIIDRDGVCVRSEGALCPIDRVRGADPPVVHFRGYPVNSPVPSVMAGRTSSASSSADESIRGSRNAENFGPA